jgi:hypothetical protein
MSTIRPISSTPSTIVRLNLEEQAVRLIQDALAHYMAHACCVQGADLAFLGGEADLEHTIADVVHTSEEIAMVAGAVARQAPAPVVDDG